MFEEIDIISFIYWALIVLKLIIADHGSFC